MPTQTKDTWAAATLRGRGSPPLSAAILLTLTPHPPPPTPHPISLTPLLCAGSAATATKHVRGASANGGSGLPRQDVEELR
jgi:hypothetical protein|eukprot:COSAG06_NODE_1607_length_8948_cov_3.854899_7_plen_81_part_00